MDLFLHNLEDNLREKNAIDKLNMKYLNDINNLLLFPLLSHYNMCEELINFNEIFILPYNEEKYKLIFEEIMKKINKNINYKD